MAHISILNPLKFIPDKIQSEAQAFQMFVNMAVDIHLQPTPTKIYLACGKELLGVFRTYTKLRSKLILCGIQFIEGKKSRPNYTLVASYLKKYPDEKVLIHSCDPNYHSFICDKVSHVYYEKRSLKDRPLFLDKYKFEDQFGYPPEDYGRVQALEFAISKVYGEESWRKIKPDVLRALALPHMDTTLLYIKEEIILEGTLEVKDQCFVLINELKHILYPGPVTEISVSQGAYKNEACRALVAENFSDIGVAAKIFAVLDRAQSPRTMLKFG